MALVECLNHELLLNLIQYLIYFIYLPSSMASAETVLFHRFTQRCVNLTHFGNAPGSADCLKPI